MSVLLNFVFLPPSLFVKAMSAISFCSMANAGASEARGKHLRYSKFWDVTSTKVGRETKVSSRIGMLAAYTPALAVSLASLVLVGSAGQRSLLLSSVLTLHYLKRVLEVLFVHQYSGQMMLDTVIPISFSYFINTFTTIYAQNLVTGMAEPELDLKYPGVALFLAGITGNFYHHYLLSKLRKKDDKGYKVPTGGLFGLVICPHYLFEIIQFIGIGFISQTIFAFSFTFGTMFYLMGRSYATRKWYLSKFENFPTDVKALIPYIF